MLGFWSSGGWVEVAEIGEGGGEMRQRGGWLARGESESACGEVGGMGEGGRMRHREPWPRVDREHLAACHFCDALHDAPELEEGKTAYCGKCGAVLYRNRPASLDRSVAFGLAVLLLMVVAQGFPFLSLDAKGVRTAMTLTQAAGALMAEGSVVLGVAVAVFTLVAPVVLAAGLVYVCLPLRWGVVWPGAMMVTKWLERLVPWAMVEVFFLGALVSLLKLVKLADVSLGVAFWALAGVMIFLAAAIGGIDRRELWDRLEVAAEK